MLGFFLLWVQPGPASAKLNEGNFVPCSESLKETVSVVTTYYYVEEGDTLWNICHNYNADLEAIKKLNDLDDNAVLTVGEQLQLPNEAGNVHVVKQGETLWDVAMTNGVSLAELCQLNTDIAPQNLKIGTCLKLPSEGRIVSSDYVKPSRSNMASTLLSWPIIGAITSPYGWRSSGFHHGLDIAGNYGDPVRSAAAGIVSFTGWDSVYGNMVTIDHFASLQTVYAHLSRILVTAGEHVPLREEIGEVGSTGNATGPHLHFEVRIDRKTINPANMLR
jgi:murein DD-endopeptidase MepM/ murein hydrolase activator NlpD